MKLTTFRVGDGAPRLGVATTPGMVADLQASADLAGIADGRPELRSVLAGDMIGFLEAGNPAMDMAREIAEFVSERGDDADPSEPAIQYPEADITMMSPIPRPLSIRDFSCVEEHYQGARDKLGNGGPIPSAWYDWPPFYKANPLIVVGPETDIIWPDYAEEMDYELEVALVIGKRGKDIPESRASDYIAGFTIFNDMTVRNVQRGEWSTHVGFSKSKDFDTGNVLGPYLVTPDEFDGKEAVGTVRVNDEVRGVGNLNKMYHSWERLIEHTSQAETLHPGEVFGSGSIGKGSGMELDRYLAPGDLIELTVDGLGSLRNRVIKP